jgi:hypothetical protein
MKSSESGIASERERASSDRCDAEDRESFVYLAVARYLSAEQIGRLVFVAQDRSCDAGSSVSGVESTSRSGAFRSGPSMVAESSRGGPESDVAAALQCACSADGRSGVQNQHS